MRKLVLPAAIILVILIGVALAVNKNSNNSTSNNQTQTQSNKSSSSSSSQTASTGSIDIRNMMFTPSQITVEKGGTVTWTNSDSTAHTVIDDLSNIGGPASGTIQPGGTYSFTFNKAGSFQYHCSLHPSMRGTIVVK